MRVYMKTITKHAAKSSTSPSSLLILQHLNTCEDTGHDSSRAHLRHSGPLWFVLLRKANSPSPKWSVALLIWTRALK
jgi:hypothetical protein